MSTTGRHLPERTNERMTSGQRSKSKTGRCDMTTTLPQAPKYPRWEAFKRSFTQSNYITDFWNWLRR